MNEIKVEDMVKDTTGKINNGLPVQVTCIDGEQVTVEFFQGKDMIHIVEQVNINNLKLTI